MKNRKVLIISPGIEDGGMRGLGRVTLALIGGLRSIGYHPYLLTGAPLERTIPKSRDSIHSTTVRRYLDHYLAEGIGSSAFRLTRGLLLKIFIRDITELFITKRSTVIPNHHTLRTEHQPASLKQFAQLSGFVNFGLFYKLTKHLPKRFTSMIIYAVAKRCGAGIIMTASPYPIYKPLFRASSIKIVQYVHDVMPLNILETPPDSAIRYAGELKIAVKYSDLVMVSSLNAKDKLQSVIPWTDPRIVYLPIIPVEPKPTRNKIGVLEKNQLKKGKYILFMSALEKRKNVTRLLEAFELIVSKTDYKLVVVGSKGYGWDEIEQTLSGMSAKAKSRVVLTGYVSEEDKWSLLSGCGIVAHPAIDEGLGIPVIEALLARKPVVATRLPSIEEFTPVGCALYIEDPYNVFDIADKLLTAIQNKDELAPAIKKGSEIIERVFSNEAFAQRLTSVLRAYQ